MGAVKIVNVLLKRYEILDVHVKTTMMSLPEVGG